MADLITAFASLTWPLAILAIVSWFKPEIRTILSRIRKGKFLGQEIELDELQAKTDAAEVKAELPTISGELSASVGEIKPEASGTVSLSAIDDTIEEVLREAARSPKLGLMLLSTKIERAIREVIADTPGNKSRSALRPRAMVEALERTEQYSPEIGQAVGLFLSVRNRIVHGQDADSDEIARAIDSGTRLLRLLLSRPRPRPEEDRPSG